MAFDKSFGFLRVTFVKILEEALNCDITKPYHLIKAGHMSQCRDRIPKVEANFTFHKEKIRPKIQRPFCYLLGVWV